MKLSLAPIQGITLAHYRNIYSEIFGGVDSYYTPFIATSSLRKIVPSIYKDIIPQNNNNNIDIIPQLLSNNGSDFNFFASTIADMGYKEINWNIGCPSHTVTKKKKGSGILAYPDMVNKFLDEVCTNKQYDLTVKLRLGLNSLDEGINIIELLNNYPLKSVIIHARTGIQKYEGTVNLESFEILNSLSKHEVTYNGDIFTNEDFIKIKNRFPMVNSFMIGRGALRDPFLPSTIKGIITPTSEKIAKIKEFHDFIFNHYKKVLYGDKHLCDKMKEFWIYTSVHIDPSGKFLKKLKKCNTTSVYLDIIDKMFDTSNLWIE
ncbi:tRNA-dihydrouridine synthase family protein [Helicovermis profundi]|uniref:tRNA-dihydrouridine synthase n=1 Tax=Helicovermis profundi TaxID=3065157 RepID=A0AAU9ETZ7_9FIRM|nr:tRNA-dihydrouridine synthase [Clostridia bacterium S502]